MQLFITPSKNILKTAISLVVTMVVLIIAIGSLQYREKVNIYGKFFKFATKLNLHLIKKMDEKERKLESQRFHFDGL